MGIKLKRISRNGDASIAIDGAILDLLIWNDATELDLSTDGRRLIVTPLSVFSPSNALGKWQSGRVTASAKIKEILARPIVPTDQEIIDEVRSEVAGSNFDKSQLAWYKSRFRKGALPGMDGKPRMMNQPRSR